ncbi:MAG TPA: histidine phosphatase family protein [Acetobacteraceae bacterium]|jgi:broad specificity phosphatase PhoE|nr:histidine phosphatase family protein [Acetobacteraceae bacterium]
MILLRHGQSEFNVHFSATRRDPGIVDPKLTPLGHEQARHAAAELGRENIARIITSPYTRALQTAEPIASALRVPVHVNPLVGERYAFSCDVGTPRTELELAWPHRDFSHLEEIWWPTIEEPADMVLARAGRFRGEMAALPDWADTLVVSHWGFILSLTGERMANGAWRRCDPSAPAPDRLVWSA